MSEISSLLDEGIQLFKDGKLADAVARLEEAIKADPSNVQAHSYLGAAYARSGKGDLAVEQFNAAVDLEPNNVTHYFNLGQGYEAAKNIPQAVSTYRKVIALAPTHEKAKARLDALTGAPQAQQPQAPSTAPAAPPSAPAPARSMPPAGPMPTQSMPPAGPGPAPMGAQPPQQASPYGPPPSAPSPYGPPPGAQPYGGPAAPQMPYSQQPGGYGAPPMKPAGTAVLEHAINSGANWFYLIAGLSIVNTILGLIHFPIMLAVGLGFTNIIDNLITDEKIPADTKAFIVVVGIVVNLVVTGIYALFGYCASKRMRWAFIVGIVFYVIDTLLTLLEFRIIGIIIHIYALYAIFNALKADGEMRRLEAQARIPGPPVPPAPMQYPR